MADLSDFRNLQDSGGPHRAEDPYDPRAHGLNGETLDAMMKAAYTEGVLAERAVQQRAGREAAKQAFEDGRAHGVNDGRVMATREHAGAAMGRAFGRVQGLLDRIAGEVRDPSNRLSRKRILQQLAHIMELQESGERLLREGEAGYPNLP